MRALFAALAEELAAGRGAVVATVVASRGSTPRGPGARMLVRAGGPALGTVGGGAVEWEASRLARDLCREGRSLRRTYRLTNSQAGDLGMICGGEADILFQYVAPAGLPQVREIGRALKEGAAPRWLVTAFAPDGWRWGLCDAAGSCPGLSDLPRERLLPLLKERPVLAEGEPALFIQPLAPAGTVYLFGGGHVGRALVPILAMAAFRVAVCDQRPDAASRDTLPQAAEIYCLPYEDAFAHLPPVTAADYVVVMTPGHEGDYEVLRQALRTPARYIGCIGSRRKAATLREKLLSEGFPAAAVDRVRSPIGLPIGGDTPAEIAVSIAAQLIACRSGRLEEGERHGG